MKKGSTHYKIIIDSNIWISFLIGKSLKSLHNYIDSDFVKIITCNEQRNELIEVFKKPKISKYFSKKQIEEFFELLDESAEVVTITSKINICRDQKDNYLVALAIDSKADFLITGDNDLLDLLKIGNTSVIKFADFEKSVL